MEVLQRTAAQRYLDLLKKCLAGYLFDEDYVPVALKSRAPAGSYAAACVPATRSGSCCVAPTTSSSSGGTRPHRERSGRRSSERSQGELVKAATTASDQPPEPS
jgi:hypothetical protein